MNDPFELAADAERASHRRRRHAARRSALRVHAAAYVAVHVLLVGVWAMGGGGSPWWAYSLLGWGVGLAVHAAVVTGARRPVDA